MHHSKKKGYAAQSVELADFGAEQIPRFLLLQAGRIRSRAEGSINRYSGSAGFPEELNLAGFTLIVGFAEYHLSGIVPSFVSTP